MRRSQGWLITHNSGPGSDDYNKCNASALFTSPRLSPSPNSWDCHCRIQVWAYRARLHSSKSNKSLLRHSSRVSTRFPLIAAPRPTKEPEPLPNDLVTIRHGWGQGMTIVSSENQICLSSHPLQMVPSDKTSLETSLKNTMTHSAGVIHLQTHRVSQ